ncbi:MAG: ABC transporter substrate-binding protein [Acidothermales bacterium]|nr:ABC transporter substrate-binding protein [Acidothermales bacterium]
MAVAVPGTGSSTSRTLTRRSLLGLLGCGAGGAVLAGCGSATPGAHESSAAISVTDQRGKKLTFARPVRRVVTIPMPAAAMFISVDESADHLVGMHKVSWLAIRDGVMGQMFPRANKIAHGIADQEFAPNVESVLALNPDLVVQWGDEGSGIIAPLENAGLKVLGLTYGTQQDLDVWINLFGTLLGKQARAKRMVAWSHARLAEMKAARPPGPAPKILYFNRFVGGYKVATKNTYNDFYITLVGGTNPASGPHGLHGNGMAGVDVEQVLAWDPDIVLLGNFDAAMPDDVYGNKVLRDMSAVRTRRVYKVPLGGYRWDPPSQESPLMWRWLSLVAFPAGKRVDLRGEIVKDYRFLYGRTPTDAQIDEILWLEANGASANYKQFHAA